MSKNTLKRLLPIGVIAAGLIGFFALGGPDYISLESLKENREYLAGLVDNNFLIAFLGFIALYMVLVGISFPGAGLLSIFGGFLFGTLTGAAGILIGATLGACIIFWAVKLALGDSMAQKMGPYMQKFEAGLKQNELSYLFVLRLIPIFPFFVVNVVPALFDVKFRNYFIATLFGIIPGAIVFASIGDGASAIFEKGEDLSLKGVMLEPRVLLPIIGLITLSLIPVFYNKYKAKTA
ncbi:MAG: TVP38/TMEM64 family protein [Hellea sp.]|nr:TVP38/TMEM64 family protein [Hellea sp.]